MSVTPTNVNTKKKREKPFTIEQYNNMILAPFNGEYNMIAHTEMSERIHNIAKAKWRTNQTVDIEDLEQWGWVKVFKVIDDYKKRNVEINLSYLTKAVSNELLARCMSNSKYFDNVDATLSKLFNQTPSEAAGTGTYATAKQEIEYDVACQTTWESDQIDLVISLENIIDAMYNMEEEDIVSNHARDWILISYIKQYDGRSAKIINYYQSFYAALPTERQALLDNMDKDKFTNNAAYKVLGLRATDNISTKVRARVKVALQTLWFTY